MHEAKVRSLLASSVTSQAVDVQTAADGVEVLVLSDQNWIVEIEWEARMNPRFIYHRSTRTVVADYDYCYDVQIAASDGPGYTGPAQRAQSVFPLQWQVDTDETGTRVVLLGRVDFGDTGPTDIAVEHVLTLSTAEGTLSEKLSLLHQHGRDRHVVTAFRFAMRKMLFDRSDDTWIDGADALMLVAAPFRRRRGQRVDAGVDGYAVQDLIPSGFSHAPRPDRVAEAWLVQGPQSGTLVAKYSQQHIEFGVIDAEFVHAAAAARGSSHLSNVPSEASVSIGHLCLRFGGAAQRHGAPGFDLVLGPDARLDFGETLIARYGGTWQEGYAAYKRMLRRRGHRLRPGYESSLQWNELYRLSWRVGTNAPLPSLETVLAEAEIASRSGAETFYFDPGWDLYEGSTVWDEARLGPLSQFVQTLDQEYGLKLGLHVMMHTKGLEEEHPDIYRRDREGKIEIWAGPYSGGFVCPASPSLQRLKTQRLLQLAASGVSFFLFDFLDYRMPEEFQGVSRNTDGCWAPGHGHSLPCTLEEHISGILTIVQEVKKEYPGLVVELHDRVAGGLGDYLPLYLDHGSPISFDEHWGFEYMWDPYMDLLSGRALSLYDYNLAYDIPLYLHINNAHDSDTNLAFWWYASTCRHLGVGGLSPDNLRWPGFVDAIARYKKLRNPFVQGDFVGIDQLTHLHVSTEDSTAVLLAFNLSSRPESRAIRVPLEVLGGADLSKISGGSAGSAPDGLVIEVEIEPLAPAIVTIGFDG
ncbi:hypothetical protein [Jiangella asiatica]|uniref:Uncharacterized protein n=1 Tax=Jiangella asiatica TaxID=2530372 RepID=A0A4R5DCZ4_9ACTN|nr:hypothetical protein [Jiangella asiatica]TDE09701.1 hypothetical protein E1269_13835 [Jiangella asiatica]